MKEEIYLECGCEQKRYNPIPVFILTLIFIFIGLLASGIFTCGLHEWLHYIICQFCGYPVLTIGNCTLSPITLDSNCWFIQAFPYIFAIILYAMGLIILFATILKCNISMFSIFLGLIICLIAFIFLTWEMINTEILNNLFVKSLYLIYLWNLI